MDRVAMGQVFLRARILSFDVHVAVHRDKFLKMKPTRCTNFSNFIFGMKFYMFWTVPLSISRSFSLYTLQWYMSYKFSGSLVLLCVQ